MENITSETIYFVLTIIMIVIATLSIQFDISESKKEILKKIDELQDKKQS